MLHYSDFPPELQIEFLFERCISPPSPWLHLQSAAVPVADVGSVRECNDRGMRPTRDRGSGCSTNAYRVEPDCPHTYCVGAVGAPLSVPAIVGPRPGPLLRDQFVISEEPDEEV